MTKKVCIFGSLFQEARSQTALSQWEISVRAGTHLSNVNQVEAGNQEPNVILAVKMLLAVNADYPKQEAVERVLAHLGQPYDWYYLPGNGRTYCSELVEESYLYADSTRIFPAKPMRFRAADGTMPQFWTDLFHRLGASVPEGEPGTNPNDMSRFSLLHTVRVFR